MEGPSRLIRIVLLLGAVVVSWASLPAFASPEGEVAAALVSEQNYRYYLDDMLYTHDGDDRGFGPEHDLARDNILDLMTSFGLDVSLDPFPALGQTYYNVVGVKVGTTYPNQAYVIGAHYDSVNNPGADDNASGTALVLEAARVLSAYDSEYTIYFVAFDREEQGLYGSEDWVDDHITDDIMGMIAADMVAYNLNGASYATVETFSTYSAHAADVSNAINTYGRSLTPYTSYSTCCSDHMPFAYAGFPAVLLIEDWGNPFYHTQLDSVDTPDYIDYTYATDMTRSVVGYLVDHAGVQVPVPDADWNGDGQVDQTDLDAFGDCFGGSGVATSAGCEFFDFDLDGDVDCTDADLLAAVWTGAGDPPPSWQCIQLPATIEADGSRCFSVTPPEHGLPVALLVTSDPDDPNMACLSQYVQAGGQLRPDPVFQTYDVWGTLNVCDDAIIGGTYYKVRCDYGAPGAPVLSSGVSITTSLWGDVAGDFVAGAWTEADGVIDFNDISAVVDAFRMVPSAPSIARADLVGAVGSACRPDGVIDFGDIGAAVDAFRSLPYWVSTGCPPPCGP